MRVLLCAIWVLAGIAVAAAQPLSDNKDNKVLIHDVQERLKAAGYDIGGLDGAYGGRTGKALDAFVADKGLAGATLAEQLEALGVPLAAIDNLTFEIQRNRGQTLLVENGLDNGIDELISQYNWKSFDIGRYAVSDDGVETFSLDLTYCNRFDLNPDDCETRRSRSQLRDDAGTFSRHTVYTFEVNFGPAPEAATRAFQYAEIYQAGMKMKHPETGEVVDAFGRFALMIENDQVRLIDNTFDDVATRFGDRIAEVDQPVQFDLWRRVDLEVFWSNGEDGYFRYWIDGKALWQKTGRNTACKLSATTSQCRFQFKYGPYVSQGGGDAWRGVDLVENPLVVRYRGLRKITDPDEVNAHVGALPQDFLSTLAFGEPQEPMLWPMQLFTRPTNLQIGHAFTATAASHRHMVTFTGTYNSVIKDFIAAAVVFDHIELNARLEKRLREACGSLAFVRYSSGVYPAITLDRVEKGKWTFANVACVAKEMGDPALSDFLLSFTGAFSDSVVALMNGPGANEIKSEYLKIWMQEIADGRIVVR